MHPVSSAWKSFRSHYEVGGDAVDVHPEGCMHSAFQATETGVSPESFRKLGEFKIGVP